MQRLYHSGHADGGKGKHGMWETHSKSIGEVAQLGPIHPLPHTWLHPIQETMCMGVKTPDPMFKLHPLALPSKYQSLATLGPKDGP